jgi:CO/xanthine dehydrogenase Mo-binding subunit
LEPGDRLITNQVIGGTAPVRAVIEACASAPVRDDLVPLGPGTQEPVDERRLPGGVGRTSDPQDLRRGVGFAVGFKNIAFSEGADDFSTARVRLERGVATVTCACAEVGQGFVTLAQQITREVLGVDEVVLAPADTSIGSAGSTSASRQTWMSGGAVLAAAEAVKQRVVEQAARRRGVAVEALDPDDVDLVEEAGDDVFEETVEHHHAPTAELDEDGQGDAHLSFAFAAHRAVVDVDPDLGLVRLVDLVTAQDVGKVLNPVQLLGQLEVQDGLVRNPSFTDYLIPTTLDVPELRIAALIEEAEPGAPFGAKGVGEPPTISSSAAVAAAVRDATGLALPRIPIRPHDIALAGDPSEERSR